MSVIVECSKTCADKRTMKSLKKLVPSLSTVPVQFNAY